MPVNPQLSSVHVDTALSSIAINYMQNPDGFFARKVFPVVPVNKQSDKYFVFDRGDMLRDEAARRTPGTQAARGGYRLSSTSYECEEFAYAHELPDEVRVNMDLAGADQYSVKHVAQKLLIREDRMFYSAFMQTSVWSNDSSPGTKWNSAGGTPIQDIRTGIRTVKNSIGYDANVGLVTRNVFDSLLDNADIIDRINGMSTAAEPAVANNIALARIFGLEEVIVAESIYDSAADGQTESVGPTTGSDEIFLLLYRPKAPSIDSPSAGYTFAWSDFDGLLGGSPAIRQYREEHRKQDVYEGSIFVDQVKTAAGAGYFLYNVLA